MHENRSIERRVERLQSSFRTSRCASLRFAYITCLPAIVRNDVVPFVSRRAGDECDHRLGIAHVEDFMRHAGLDVNEIAGLVFDHLFQALLRIRVALFLR